MSNPRSFSFALVRAWRSLMRRPGSFLIAASSLAIALGLATTVIAQIDALRNPFTGMRDADQLYVVQLRLRSTPGKPAPTELDVLTALRASPAIESVVGVEFPPGGSLRGDYNGTPVRVPPEFFSVTGTVPLRGRLFSKDETNAMDVALVTDAYWKRTFADHASLDSALIPFDGRQVRVVGIVPYQSTGVLSASVIFPRPNTAPPWSYYVARASRGVSRDELKESVTSIAQQLGTRFGAGSKRPWIVARPLQRDPLRLTTLHRALAGASVFILLIACANVSALMLARSVTQRRDQALKLALGARVRDLVRDVGAELTILASIGTAAGLLIGYWTTRVVIATTPPELAWMGFREPRWSVGVFGGLTIAVLIAVALSALVPVLHVSKVSPADPLKNSSGTTTGRRSRDFQVLVVTELALAMVLLFGAGLITKAAANVAAYDFGYDARSVVEFEVGARVVRPDARPNPNASPHTKPTISEAEFVALVERVKTVPGVANAAWVAPGGGSPNMYIATDAKSALERADVRPHVLDVGPGFVGALGLQLLAGRDFVAGDGDRDGAVILDEATAKALFPNGDAVGHLITFPSFWRNVSFLVWVPVVGIVENAMHRLPFDPVVTTRPTVYATGRSSEPHLVVRAAVGARDIAPPVTRMIRDLVGSPKAGTATKWVSEYEEVLNIHRFVARIFITLSIASLALATAGLFGVLSYAVGQRMREFAVRVALGARTPNIVRLVVRNGLVMALGGTALGGLIAFTGGFAVFDYLWGVNPIDAGALIVAEVILLAVTMASAIGPALRASRANPVEVMRAT